MATKHPCRPDDSRFSDLLNKWQLRIMKIALFVLFILEVSHYVLFMVNKLVKSIKDSFC
ncbi:MAG: hypothetical protein ETSY1_21960 [Candidatus Entotheonella factor]|uniref:Uncharacterized protein n=1 Tax=Entotheonella factor TaxID=1429438 RepID=W4LHM9_ENTF1|nr:MAG: hypothetical protein ETSY1_21960 [Candidatus Entotheonella factor]